MENFWGNNYYNNPPLTDDAIQFAEKRLGVNLPVEYLALLHLQNGGYTRGFAFPMEEQTSWAADHIPLSELSGIVIDPDSEGVHNILLTGYMIREWGLPEGLVLLSGGGHWWIALDYRHSNSPVVTWIDIEAGEDIRIAPSFQAFYEGLVPAEHYE